MHDMDNATWRGAPQSQGNIGDIHSA